MTEEVKKEYSILCASRKQLRRLATNSHASVMELFKMDKRGKVTEIPSEDEFDAKFIIAADRFDRLFQVDSQVSELIFQLNLTERELDADFDSTAEYRDKWLDLNQRKLKLYKVEPPPSENGSQNTVLTKKSRSLKLFKLEPKKYDGSLQGWIGFWAMFRTIHEDKDLDLEKKFLYLLQLTKEGSPARELLDSFPPSAQNYPKAIETLTNRFGRTDMLVELYVRELLKLVLVQATGSAKLSLSSLYDRLETQLRALESLGVVKDNFSNMLLPLVESSLPDTVLRHWERVRTSKAYQEDTPGFQGRLDELLMFLRKEVESEERLALARGTFSAADSPNVIHPKTRSIKKDSSKENSTVSTPTAAGLVNLKASPNEKTICQAIPGPPHGPWLCELKQRGIQLSDQGEGPVDVLIGADVAGKIWTGRRIVLKCGLVAMETVLGWTLMDFEHIDSSSVERRFQWRNETKQNLHLRFRTEYLGQLKLSTDSFKKTRKPMVGELVLVGSDNKKRIDWPLAIVEELIEGPDGNCRVVKLRTTDGILTRAIQKIYPLEIPLAEDSGDVQDSDEVEEVNSDGPDDDVQPDLEDGPSEVQVKTSDGSLPRKIVREVKTQCGRKVKLPVKFCD
ncbi:hypothetical protein GE061_015987 [Apolygus lucorum]|uniref:DUF5641 domain-containing protein n=1 Tax=Apolygus lucorum TaxID=248454 RepID=A0A8S9XEP8_APOLU|nr:hypothetical protein GE061_015987 [Apolygus lucorum]